MPREKVKVYWPFVPFWTPEPVTRHVAWMVGPPHAWNVGDEFPIPDRGPRLGVERPGCDLARVTETYEDGLARAVDVEYLTEREQATAERWAA